jgi:hypothetical protein
MFVCVVLFASFWFCDQLCGFYADFMHSARIRTFVFYFMFLFVLILICFCFSFFAEFGMLYVHCAHMFVWLQP